MYHEDTESKTQTKDQIIHVFAFFTFSSSPHETRYIIPLIISAITAITATYLISSAMSPDTNWIGLSELVLVEHHGSPPQSILGAAAKTCDTKSVPYANKE